MFNIRKSGENVFEIATDLVKSEFTVYAQPTPVQLMSLAVENAVFHDGEDPNLDFAYTAIFRCMNNTMVIVNNESDLGKMVVLISGDPIITGQTYLSASFRGFRFDIPITVID